MPKLAQQFSRLLAMQWSANIQYRADLILWTITEAMTPLIAFVVWYNVSLGSKGPYTPHQTIIYYILVVLATIVTQAWGGFALAQDILNGQIVVDLMRPINIFWKYLAGNIVEKSIKLVIPAVIALGVLLIKPSLFSWLITPQSQVALFVVSLILATALNFFIDMALAMMAFWLEDANELRRFKFLLDEVSSGALIPLVMLPPLARSIFNFFPARYVISAPIEIFMGQQAGLAAWHLLGVQVVWLVGLAAILYISWTKGLKRYAVPGQ